MMGTGRWSSSATVALLTMAMAAGVSSPALAQSPEHEAEARSLFELGQAAAGRGDHVRAAELLARSYELFPHPGTLNNLAISQASAGQRAAAHRSYRELIDRFGAVLSPAGREQASAQLAELEAALATVEVASDPEGVEVLVDEARRGVTPLAGPLLLEPGQRRVEGRLTGCETVLVERTLQPGPNPAIRLAPVCPTRETGAEPSPAGPAAGLDASAGLEIEPAPSTRAETPDASATPRRRSFWRGPWPWVIGGLLVAGAATAIGVTLGTRDEEQQTDWSVTFR
jgi:hypothetical protein